MLDETQMRITPPMAGEYESWQVFALYQYILEFCISYCETSDTISTAKLLAYTEHQLESFQRF